jgi:hypothetical protein
LNEAGGEILWPFLSNEVPASEVYGPKNLANYLNLFYNIFILVAGSERVLEWSWAIWKAIILIEISKNHVINGKLESIENDVEPIVAQLNAEGMPIDIDLVGKIQADHLVIQEELAEKIYGLVGFKFNIGKKD